MERLPKFALSLSLRNLRNTSSVQVCNADIATRHRAGELEKRFRVMQKEYPTNWTQYSRVREMKDRKGKSQRMEKVSGVSVR